MARLCKSIPDFGYNELSSNRLTFFRGPLETMHESPRLDQQQRWQRGERPLVEEYLRTSPGLAADLESLAELICGEISLREARGEKPLLDEYLRRFPQCKEPVQRRLAASTATQPPSPGAAPATHGEGRYETIAFEPRGELAAATAALDPSYPIVPGFEILSELGRGGMGVVYKARQVSADRVVALKVVRTDVLASLPSDTRSSTLERFRQEGQAAAKLEHDNLVTVYEVGQAGEVCYYAMRYVQGRNLNDMLQTGPLDNQRAARFLEPVARALHAAHLRGILHRDLKPHNIMVDERTDRPLVTDFGLAKFMERGNELTHAGEVMGTPSYMSPEQTRDAGKVTAAADVYSLGATLYHLLTARPPFQAANLGETIRQIIHDEPVPPRRLNPAINRDLETICLKCLQKEPARRYGSAELLAADLARYLEGRPILARPVGLYGRAWRWCRRNPLIAALIAAATTFALVSLLAIVVGYYNTAAALAKSESRLQKALQVVNELFTRVSEDELLNEPGMQPLRKDLLERALKHYEYFLAESGGNPAVQDEVAASRFRVGLINQLTGGREAAREALTTARDLQRDLSARRPADPARLKALADTLNALGSLHKEMRGLDQAADSYREAKEIRGRLVQTDPANQEFRRLLANTRMNLGMVDLENARLTEAAEEMRAAQAARQEILAADPQNAKVRRDLAMGFYNLQRLSLTNNQLEPAAQQLRAAIEQFETLLTRDARSLANRYHLAVCYRQLGGLQAELRDDAGALASYGKALEHLETLAAGNPEVPLYQTELAVLAMNQASLYGDQQNQTAAIASWNKARTVLEAIVIRDPQDVDHRRDLAITLSELGALQLLRGDLAIARELLTQARDRLQKLLQELPGDVQAKQQLTATLADLEKCADPQKTGNK